MTLRIQAFEVAREKMETLLSQKSAREKVDYGTSIKYPHITWETSVETFDEPISSQMWVRAVCSAQYIDSEDYEQKVELTHWLTNVSKGQMLNIIKQMSSRKKILKEQLIPTISKAATYANVTPETIQMWLDNGMPTASNGAFIKDALDLYDASDGYPSVGNVARVDKMYKFISQSIGSELTTMPSGSGSTGQQSSTGQSPTKGGQDQSTSPQSSQGQSPEEGGRTRPPPESRGEEVVPGTGITLEDLGNMSGGELWKFLMKYFPPG
jgi:hypothetical protein